MALQTLIVFVLALVRLLVRVTAHTGARLEPLEAMGPITAVTLPTFCLPVLPRELKLRSLSMPKFVGLSGTAQSMTRLAT